MRLGLPEIPLFVILAIYVVSIVLAVRAKKPWLCYGLGVMLIALVSFSEFWHGFAFGLGFIMGNAIAAGIVAVSYWGLAGRKRGDLGNLRASKIFFWLSLVLPILSYTF